MEKKPIKLNTLYNVINQSSVILFQLITMKYVSSVLHAENYGRFSFCNSILGYFLLLAQLGINSYVVREGAGIREDRNKLEDLVGEVFTINFWSTILSVMLYVIAILVWTKLRNERYLLYMLGIHLALNLFNVEWIYNIFEDFKYLALRNLCVQIIAFLCMLVFVRDEEDYLKYAFIFALSASLGYCISYIHGRRLVRIRITSHPKLKIHLKPILLLFFNSLAILVYVNSDITILGIMKSDAVVGMYSVSVKVYTVVKRIFQAIVIVAVPRLSSYYANGETEKYKKLLKRMHDAVVTVVIPMLIGLIMTSENAIRIVSGEEYMGGVNSLRILCLALIFSSLANYYVSCVLLPGKKDKTILTSTVISSVVNIVLNLFLIPVFSLNGAALTTVIAEAIVTLLAYRASGPYRQNKECVGTYVKVAAGGIGIVLTCLVVGKLGLPLLFDTALKIALSVFVYFGLEVLLKNTVVTEMIGNIRSSLIKKLL